MTDGSTDSDTPGVPEHGKKKRTVVEPAPPARVMSIHAHPDDQEFTVGGTLAKWAQAGTTVVTVCITRGTGGSNRFTPLDMTREALGPIREASSGAPAGSSGSRTRGSSTTRTGCSRPPSRSAGTSRA